MSRALVTGASSGLGAEYARQLAELGYDLILVARDRRALQAVADEIEQRGRSAEIIIADLTVPAELDRVSSALQQRDIGFLVNNAGIGSPGSFLRSDPADEQRLIDLNVAALTTLTHAVLPGMVRRGRGCVLNVSSVAAYVPSDSGPAYSASKAYVSMFTESLAIAVAGTGVRVCAVCPGFIHTSFHQRLGMDTGFIPSWAWLNPPQVVRQSLHDVARGRTRSIPSVKYKVATFLATNLPRSLMRRVIGASNAATGRSG